MGAKCFEKGRGRDARGTNDRKGRSEQYARRTESLIKKMFTLELHEAGRHTECVSSNRQYQVIMGGPSCKHTASMRLSASR